MRSKAIPHGVLSLLLLAAPLLAAQEANQGFLTVRQVMEANCSACHDWASTHKGIADPTRVTPGFPEKSPLYTMVAGDSMPMGAEPLPVTQKNLLRAWIAAGATASEEPLVLTMPEGSGTETGTAALPAAPSGGPVRRFNKVKFHQISGFTSASLFLAAGAVGAVQWGTLISEGHAERDRLGIDEDQISSVCADYIADLWANPLHRSLRLTHVSLLSAGEALYLYNAVTGIGMRTKDRPGLTPQDLHRYAFFTHATLMVTELVMGAFTTSAIKSGSHWTMVGVGAAHTAVGLAIPLVMIGSGIAINRSLKRK
jgi:hypothetical protein